MKKSILLVAALFAAFTINAKEVVVDLSKYATIAEKATVTPSLTDGVLKIDYTNTGEWDGFAGVSFTLNSLDVTNLSYEFIGDEKLTAWTSLIVYLEDTEGVKWFNQGADLHISGWEGSWSSQSYFPTDALWATPTHKAGDKPFVSLGFMTNGANATSTYSIRNVKLTVEEATAIDNTAVDAKAVKVIRDGQVVILRDGKTFNALGAEMK